MFWWNRGSTKEGLSFPLCAKRRATPTHKSLAERERAVTTVARLPVFARANCKSAIDLGPSRIRIHLTGTGARRDIGWHRPTPGWKFTRVLWPIIVIAWPARHDTGIGVASGGPAPVHLCESACHRWNHRETESMTLVSFVRGKSLTRPTLCVSVRDDERGGSRGRAVNAKTIIGPLGLLLYAIQGSSLFATWTSARIGLNSVQTRDMVGLRIVTKHGGRSRTVKDLRGHDLDGRVCWADKEESEVQ